MQNFSLQRYRLSQWTQNTCIIVKTESHAIQTPMYYAEYSTYHHVKPDKSVDIHIHEFIPINSEREVRLRPLLSKKFICVYDRGDEANLNYFTSYSIPVLNRKLVSICTLDNVQERAIAIARHNMEPMEDYMTSDSLFLSHGAGM